LTQQVAAASCSLTSGVDVEEAHEILEHATLEFDRYLFALRHGDEELHILRPEERRRTLEDLDHVEAEWQAILQLIELAGRQRMLTQKMAKDACEIWTDYHAEEGRADLRETMVIFENSLKALRFGYADAGISEAPNDAIRTDLDILLERWGVLKVNLQTLVDGGDLNEEQKYEVFHDLEVELVDLDHLIEDYKEYAERAH